MAEKTVYGGLTRNPLLRNTTEARVYQYDANGNQTYMECSLEQDKNLYAKPRVGFSKLKEELDCVEVREYNGSNQLISVFKDDETTSYAYKPNGLRYSKRSDKNTKNMKTMVVHLWDGQNMVADLNANGSVRARYLRGLGLIGMTQDYNTLYYLHNSHGDVTYLTNDTGNTLHAYEYDAFGVEVNPNPQDYNPFRYCGNNPVRYVDPTGLAASKSPWQDYDRLEDGKYSSSVQAELLQASSDYHYANYTGDTAGAATYQKKIASLRSNKHQGGLSRFFDTNASKMDNNLVLANTKALSLGYASGTERYDLVVTSYALALNDIDEKGEVQYRNKLMMFALQSLVGMSARNVKSVDSTHQVVESNQQSYNPLDRVNYSTRVTDQMLNSSDVRHSFPSAVDSFGASGHLYTMPGGDGQLYTHLEPVFSKKAIYVILRSSEAMKMGYNTDLSDKQWEIIATIFKSNKGKNFAKHAKRDLVNAVLYLVKTGCQWRLLPNDFPPYTAVWSFYRRAVESGKWEKATALLVKKQEKQPDEIQNQVMPSSTRKV